MAGLFEVSAECTLTLMIALVQTRVEEVMGEHVGEVAGLLIQGGTLDEAEWQKRGERLTVAIGWAWSS